MFPLGGFPVSVPAEKTYIYICISRYVYIYIYIYIFSATLKHFLRLISGSTVYYTPLSLAVTAR